MRLWFALAPALALVLSQPPAAPAADNAALRYWVAFDQLPQLTPEQQKALDASPPALDATAEAIVKSAEKSLHYLHRGAAIATCDWGPEMQDGPYVLLPHLAKARQLGRLACLRARLHFAAGRTAAGLDDLFDTLTLARHCGPGTMIAVLVQYAIEVPTIDTLAAELPRLDKTTLARLPARLDRLPAVTRVGQTLEHEKRWFLDWLKAKITESRGDAWREELLKMFEADEDKVGAQKFRAIVTPLSGADAVKALDRLGAVYDEMGKLLDLPPDQFAAKWPGFKAATNSANPLAEILLPSIAKLLERENWARAKQALLRAGIAVAQDGPAAAQKHPDPFGQGPFEYQARPQGFELRSKVVFRDQPVTLTVGAAK